MSNGSLAFSGAVAWVLPDRVFAKDKTAAVSDVPLNGAVGAGGIPV